MKDHCSFPEGHAPPVVRFGEFALFEKARAVLQLSDNQSLYADVERQRVVHRFGYNPNDAKARFKYAYVRFENGEPVVDWPRNALRRV
jgi:hypothetical protein